MESTGKRQKRLKLNKDFVPIPSDESDVNDEDMIPFNSQITKRKLVKAPIAVEMETNCDSSSVSNLNNFNELIAAQIEKLNNVDQDEYLYRKNANKIFNIVFRKRLHCTMCDIHIGYQYGQKLDRVQHPLLKVLACTECINEYNEIDFKLSPDGQDQFCRWCGITPMEKVPLRHCSACPFAFCEACILYNLSISEIKITNNWLCAVCNMKELWPLRNIFSSLVDFSTNLSRTDDKQGKGTDLAQCCANTTAAEVTSDNHSDMKIETNVEPKSTSSYRPLPASKMESKWMRVKIREMSSVLENLTTNLNRVADGTPDIEDKFTLKSRLISVDSLLTIGLNQMNNFKTDLQHSWEMFEEEKRHKLCDNNSKDIDDEEKTNGNPPTGLTEGQTEEFYRLKYKIKPCSVNLIRAMFTKQ